MHRVFIAYSNREDPEEPAQQDSHSWSLAKAFSMPEDNDFLEAKQFCVYMC